MMLSAQHKGKIPIKCFVKKGSSCLNAVMTKIMMCDEPRTHHHPTCIGGKNFGDCYDRVPHPPASIALQSWGIAQEPIQILLLAMQTMHFFLCTGFAESTKSYGGSDEDRTLGLGQGNAAAGPGFLALSSLIINAYLRKGHGTRQVSNYSKRTLDLVAVIYMDDTDLPHMTKHVTATATELIEHLQQSTNVWKGLASATRLALKPEKCYAYFMTYMYTKGRASMADITNLPTPICMLLQSEGLPLPSHITVPLPDCTLAPIPTLSTNTALLMLGIWFGPSSCRTKHMLEMC